jgi:hypothetical protein
MKLAPGGVASGSGRDELLLGARGLLDRDRRDGGADEEGRQRDGGDGRSDLALESGETVEHFFLLIGINIVDAGSFAGDVPNGLCGGKAPFLSYS